MAHNTELVDFETLSNGQFAVHIVCCGAHEHRRTIGPEVADVQASIEEAHRWAAREHKAALEIKAHLESLRGSKVEHK
jgi:hypothetical protein